MAFVKIYDKVSDQNVAFLCFPAVFPLIKRLQKRWFTQAGTTSWVGLWPQNLQVFATKTHHVFNQRRLRISIVVAGPGMATAGKAQNATAPLAGSFMVGHSGTWSSPIQAGVGVRC